MPDSPQNPEDRDKPSLASRAFAVLLWAVFGALLVGGTNALWPYYRAFFDKNADRTTRERAERQVETEHMAAVKNRFWWGAAIGGPAVGLYWLFRRK